MGLVIKKISIEDYLSKEVIYSKLIRGDLSFKFEGHHLKNGQCLQLYFYRDHPRTEEFVQINEQRHHLTEQGLKTETQATQLRLMLNDQEFMINSISGASIDIKEYNFNQSIKDFTKGKVAILINIGFPNNNDNTKLLGELKSFFRTEVNNEANTGCA